jgi:hypothetical protein
MMWQGLRRFADPAVCQDRNPPVSPCTCRRLHHQSLSHVCVTCITVCHASPSLSHPACPSPHVRHVVCPHRLWGVEDLSCVVMLCVPHAQPVLCSPRNGCAVSHWQVVHTRALWLPTVWLTPGVTCVCTHTLHACVASQLLDKPRSLVIGQQAGLLQAGPCLLPYDKLLGLSRS